MKGGQQRLVVGAIIVLLAGCRSAMPFRGADTPRAVPVAHYEFTEPAPAPGQPFDSPAPPSAMGEITATGAEGQPEVEGHVRLASFQADRMPDAGSLTLNSAISMGLEYNADLVAIRAGEPVAHAAYHVAKTYPFNPQFQTQVLPYTRYRDGNDAPVSQQHVIVQTFEWGGQQRFRAGAAAADWERVRGTIQQAELLNIAQTERLFFTALYHRELLELSRTVANLNEQLAGVMERRMQAGQSNAADVALARLQAQSSRRQQRLADATYQNSLANLRIQLNLDANVPLVPAGEWRNWRWLSFDDGFLDRSQASMNPIAGGADWNAAYQDAPQVSQLDETLLRQLVANRPDVVAAQAAVQTARANRGLADAMRRPDLQIGPMYQKDDSSTQFWGIQAQMDIPIVNTGMPLVQQRTAELHQQQITASQLEDKAVSEAGAAIQRYERARRLLEQSRDELILTIPDALKPFEEQFQAGQIDLLQVFSARTSIAQSVQSLLDLLNEVALAAADVTQATGLPPQDLVLEMPPAPSRPEEFLVP